MCELDLLKDPDAGLTHPNVLSYMLILDQHLQLWLVGYVENNTHSTLFDDITRILHL